LFNLSCSVNFLRKGLNLLLYSNIYIAICAVSLVFTNQITTGVQVVYDDSCSFVLFSTIFTYSWLKFRRGNSPVTTAHQHWAEQNGQLYRNILLISLLATAVYFFRLNTPAKLYAIGAGVVTAFYGFANIPFVKPKTKLRHIGLLKTAFVGIVWSVTTVLIPMAGQPVEDTTLLFLLLRRFLFVMALTTAFEIKDLKTDSDDNLRTIPMLLGIGGTKLLAQGFLLLLAVVTTVEYLYWGLPFYNVLAVNVSLVLSMALIQPLNEDTPDIWYFLGLDGMMIVQFVLVYTAHLLFV